MRWGSSLFLWCRFYVTICIGIPGAAAFAAMRAYEKHQEANGRPPQHQLAKEILAGFAGAEVIVWHFWRRINQLWGV
jgi:hypothetical protein